MRLKRVTIGLIVVLVMSICLSLVSGAPPQNQSEQTNEEAKSKTSVFSAVVK